MSDPILQLAELRRIEVDVEGNKIFVREFSASEYSEVQRIKEQDPDKAIAFIIQKCVLKEDGTERWTAEEAMKVASGSPRVVFRLVNAIHRLSGLGEKNE